jgi:4-hydroxy 2-oxovalerate aldolase
MRVLDCTLRDGGYYNNWDFHPKTVSAYLSAVESAKIDAIEMGFRFLPKNRFFGPFAYTTDRYLERLSLPNSPLFGVMINAEEFAQHDLGHKAAVRAVFANAEQSPISFVRIAVHPDAFTDARPLADTLHLLGYQVFLNLMQITTVSHDRLSDITKAISRWESVNTLYFADSLGNMTPTQAAEITEIIRAHWPFEIGIHTHDNLGNALMNCLAAADAGVDWVDATVLGMGRGAGNAATESLLLRLASMSRDAPYRPDALLPVALDHFRPLQKTHEWGPNLLYQLSATFSIHPSYIQQMSNDVRYETDDILGAIEFLKSIDARRYEHDTLRKAVHGEGEETRGKWDATGWCRGKDVLILGSGPSSQRYGQAIVHYIQDAQPTVLVLNARHDLPTELVTAYIASHERRILMDAPRYGKLKKPLIMPLARVQATVGGILDGLNVRDYALAVEEDNFFYNGNGCILNTSQAFAYALAVAAAGNANRILLAGFDGYSADDPRQEEMIRILQLYAKTETAPPIIALTPTNYPVRKGSLFAPNIS